MTQDLQEIKIIRLNQSVMNRNPEIVKEMERKMGLH